MRRFLPLLMLIILLSSCASTEKGEFSTEEKRHALGVLGNDMIAYASVMGEIPEETMAAYLPASYTAYREYVPLYDELTSDYLSSLSAIISPLAGDALEIAGSHLEEAVSLSDDDTLDNPEGLTSLLQEAAARDVYSSLLERSEAASAEAEDAFRVPYDSFTSVRDAYLNLASVGIDVSLPVPEPLSPQALAFIADDVLFSRLADAERSLRERMPESEDSPYLVFWEAMP